MPIVFKRYFVPLHCQKDKKLYVKQLNNKKIMSKQEIAGICAFAKAVNTSWGEEKVFVSPNYDDGSVKVSGKTEYVLNFVSSITNLFCAACASFVIVSDDNKPVYCLF